MLHVGSIDACLVHHAFRRSGVVFELAGGCAFDGYLEPLVLRQNGDGDTAIVALGDAGNLVSQSRA